MTFAKALCCLYKDNYSVPFYVSQTRMGAVIYARTEETALKIINMWNDMQNIFQWVKPRFRFKKKCMTSIPPYELEQEQIGTINEWSKKSHKTL